MAVVTVAGGNPGSALNPLPQSKVLVTTLLNLTQQAGNPSGSMGTVPGAGTISQNALAFFNADTVSGATTVVGGTTATDVATTVPAAASTIAGIVIANTQPTTMSNAGVVGDQVVYSGVGGLTFSDYGTADTIIAGGGTNNITFTATSKNGLFAGDGENTINVASTVAGSNTQIVGSLASSDTILGLSSVATAGIIYHAASLSSAFIDPGAQNTTIYGYPGGSETVSVFGGGPSSISGTLTVVNGNGYFQGGSHGGNNMSSDTVGSTTLIGGGANDVLLSNGPQDVIYGGLGAETLESAGVLGGVSFYAHAPGGVAQTTIDMHINGGAGSNTIIGTASGENVLINDFVSGVDKLEVVGSYTISAGTLPNQVVVSASNGSTFTFNGVTPNAKFDIKSLAQQPT